MPLSHTAAHSLAALVPAFAPAAPSGKAMRHVVCDQTPVSVHFDGSNVGWNVSETARRLDVARSHLDKLISAFGIERTHG